MTLPPQDKLAHALVGVLIYAVAHFASPIIGLAAVFTVAVGKEIYDSFHKDVHTPDIWDAAWTVGGGIVGFVCGA